MPVILTFDVPVKNKREFEKNLHVKSTASQAGHLALVLQHRGAVPAQELLEAGHQGTVTADINGLDAGNGIYGQNSTKTYFTVGRSLITKINLDTTWRRSTATASRRAPSRQRRQARLATRSGTKLIMDKLHVTRMTNEMIGAARTTTSRSSTRCGSPTSGSSCMPRRGTAAHFGRRNASHGCVGMSTANAAWLFNRSPDRRPGDHHRQQPRHGVGQRLHRLEHVLRPVQEGLAL